MNQLTSVIDGITRGDAPKVGMLNELLELCANIGIILFEFVAVVLMIFACVKTLYMFYRHKHHTVLYLRKWMNVALLFILCSEILRLITAHSFSEVIVIFCIVLIHAAISVLSNWETQNELKIYSSVMSDEDKNRLFHNHTNDINL